MTMRTILLSSLAALGLLFSGPPPARAAGATLKPPVQGLVDMQDIGFYRDGTPADFTLDNVKLFPGQFGGIVLNVTWTQLQPDPPEAQSLPRLQTGYIDDALVQVRRYNDAHRGRPLAVKLRVWGGFAAPFWAKNLAGGPVNIPVVVHGTAPQSLGRYWTNAYRRAWRNMQAALAREYDGEPLIREVAVTSCAWATDEPFVQWISPANKAISANFVSLRQAGYSWKKEIRCLKGAIGDYAAWHRTYVDYPFNPLQLYMPASRGTNNAHCQRITYGNWRFCNLDGPTRAVMKRCVASRRCVLSNQALYKEGPALIFPYDFIDRLHQRHPSVKVDFQTASPAFVTGPTGFCGAVTMAKKLHASSVELWPGAGKQPGFTSLEPAEIAALAGVMDGTGACGLDTHRR